jgi:5-deoxy-glucuronate isomerase
VTAPILEVLTVGRISVDLYPQQYGPLAGVSTFAKSLGGSPTNVAVGCARLGRRAAVWTKVGADPFGDYLIGQLDAWGVDTSYVGRDPRHPTPVVFCELDPRSEPRLLFYRRPSAPDLHLLASDVPEPVLRAVPVLWFTGTGLSAFPSREVTLAALRTRGRRHVTVFDLDWRPSEWPVPQEAPPVYATALSLATVAVGTRDEVAVAVGTRDPSSAARRLLDAGVRLAVVKLGADGVLVATASEQLVVPPVPIEVVCGLGAGDAFGAALCDGLLAGWPLETIARRANAAGAHVAARLACADAMPTRQELTDLTGAGRTRDTRARGAAVRLHWPNGSLTDGGDPVLLDPERAGWRYTTLRVLRLSPGEGRRLQTGEFEWFALPLSGSYGVQCDGERFELTGRRSVFTRVSDFAYLPRDASAVIDSATGGELALAGAYCTRRLRPRYGAAEDVPVEIRGAGRASRQVTNFGTPGAWPHADRLMAVELLTPGGNWSSYPPHRHDADIVDGVRCPVINEEIYYFRIDGGQHGFGTHRTYTADGEIDETVTVRDGDVFCVPRGYHGPCAAAPDYPMYYLNVLAGPGEQRSMAFCDDPAHAAVRDGWAGQPADPRLPLTSYRTPEEP